MSDGTQMRRLGAAVDKLFAYRPAKAAAPKRKPLRTKKWVRPKRPPAQG